MNARIASSLDIPHPSSCTRILSIPPPSMEMFIRADPASREFSRSSLITEEGDSTTSPAAILFTVDSSRTRILPMRGKGSV